MKKKLQSLTPAMAFILLFSVVSLLSDMTHEGAASIRGAYLSLLGASAATIGFVSGFGELVGYSLRFLFGKLADKTKRYWLLTIIGYTVDVLAVPALALVLVPATATLPPHMLLRHLILRRLCLNCHCCALCHRQRLERLERLARLAPL